MKARVKATGKIVDVKWHGHNAMGAIYVDSTLSSTYYEHDLDFNTVYDYWDKLLHQYAGMAMQGMIKTYEQMMRADIECKMDCCEYVDAKVANGVLRSHAEACAEFCMEFATALVEKLKEEK